MRFCGRTPIDSSHTSTNAPSSTLSTEGIRSSGCGRTSEAPPRVNVRDTWQMCRVVAPAMAEDGYGKIVNVSSGTALKDSTGRLGQVSSHAAILGLTKTLAREGAPWGNLCELRRARKHSQRGSTR
jgi:hypothetical protein